MSPSSECQKYLFQLSPYIDGELSPSERQTVDRHLAACPACAGRVADLRATSGLTRVGLEMLAEEADFSQFSQKVLAQLSPEKAPLWERLGIALSELFTYQRRQLATGFAVALLAVLAAAGWLLQPSTPAGYGSERVAVQSVNTDQGAQVAPVVMKTQKGDAIIWLVNRPSTLQHPDSGAPVPGATPVQPPNPPPTGGEL
jgi:anti-sigma factor RsiW